MSSVAEYNVLVGNEQAPGEGWTFIILDNESGLYRLAKKVLRFPRWLTYRRVPGFSPRAIFSNTSNMS
jgi:hypothetical protein